MVDNAKILNLAGVSLVAAVLPAAHADDEHEFEGNKAGRTSGWRKSMNSLPMARWRWLRCTLSCVRGTPAHGPEHDWP